MAAMTTGPWFPFPAGSWLLYFGARRDRTKTGSQGPRNRQCDYRRHSDLGKFLPCTLVNTGACVHGFLTHVLIHNLSFSYLKILK